MRHRVAGPHSLVWLSPHPRARCRRGSDHRRSRRGWHQGPQDGAHALVRYAAPPAAAAPRAFRSPRTACHGVAPHRCLHCQPDPGDVEPTRRGRPAFTSGHLSRLLEGDRGHHIDLGPRLRCGELSGVLGRRRRVLGWRVHSRSGPEPVPESDAERRHAGDPVRCLAIRLRRAPGRQCPSENPHPPVHQLHERRSGARWHDPAGGAQRRAG